MEMQQVRSFMAVAEARNFTRAAVRFVAVGDAAALRAALRAVAADPDAVVAMARRGQAHLVAGGLDAEGCVRRHVELSREPMAVSG